MRSAVLFNDWLSQHEIVYMFNIRMRSAVLFNDWLSQHEIVYMFKIRMILAVRANDWLSQHEMWSSEYSVNRPVEYANSVFLTTDHSLVAFWGAAILCVITGFSGPSCWGLPTQKIWSVKTIKEPHSDFLVTWTISNRVTNKCESVHPACIFSCSTGTPKRERQCTYYVTLRRVRAAIAAAEKR